MRRCDGRYLAIVLVGVITTIHDAMLRRSLKLHQNIRIDLEIDPSLQMCIHKLLMEVLSNIVWIESYLTNLT